MVQQSQYGTPVFIIPKKEGTGRFITYYHRINQKWVRTPYILPRIGKTTYHLEVLQCVTILDLNIGYFTIRLSLASQDMTIIVTEFDKFGYNGIPMGIYASREIFQAKVNELLGDIKGIKTYIDDILVLISI